MTPHLPALVLGAAAAVALALAVLVWVVVVPSGSRLPVGRRRPDAAPEDSVLAGAVTRTTGMIEDLLQRGGAAARGSSALEEAGMSIRPADFTLFVAVATVVAFALGLVVGGVLVALLLGLLVPVGARLLLVTRRRRRRQAFADQLDDSLQLMASSLRAGHSLMQSLASVTHEAEAPTSEEFARLLNQTRVGRPLQLALTDCAERMGSLDFSWVTQAIAINREVGGNLAEVLDGVGETIRERNQIRRQVKALAAEGKLSAVVLMLLPFGVAGFLLMSSPGYMAKFTNSLIGYIMLGTSVVLLVVGALWLRKTVEVKF